jgi:hypothetical protein
MHAFFGELIDSIPAGAYWTFGFLFFITFVLVRSALHPTVFALIAWPGTLAHELSHASVGFVLGAKPASMSLWPKSLGDGRWQLGYVEFTNLKWWSAPWTALAPMLLAPLSLGLTLVWAYPAWSAGNLGSAALALYVCATLLQASWPSTKDFEVAFPGLVVVGLIIAWLW